MIDTPPMVPSPATPPLALAGFSFDREPPVDWVERLNEVSPHTDEETGFLALVWESGDPWVPGQRWTLYEMFHEKWVDDDVLAELRGPHPRSEGHMCSVNVPAQFQCLCGRKLEKWRGGPCDIVTLTEWKLFRQTGYVGKAFWIIQGEHGGHKWEFNEHERQMLRLADKPDEPPRLGALPYAPFDERVVGQIMRHNKLRALGVSLGEFKRMMGPGYARYKAQLEQDMRREYLAYLDEQMQDVTELFLRAAEHGEMDNQPRTDIDWERVEDASRAQYIEDGTLLHPSMVK